MTLVDPDTYRLIMIEDPCTWSAKTGSAPMDGATFYRTKPQVASGTYTKTISLADAEKAGGDLLKLAGQWELQLDGKAGIGKFTLQQAGKVVDSGGYINVDNEFVLNATRLCASGGESLGTFKSVVEGHNVSFFKTRADCAALIFVLKTQPWVKQ